MFDRSIEIPRVLFFNSSDNEFNSFFGIKNIKLKINEEIVNDSERILKVKKEHKKTQEEKRKELLEISPELKFLFDDPFNCKFID